MVPRPIAKGWCENCGSFLIWDKSKLKVTMHERPNIPEVTSKCQSCLLDICTPISFKDAFTFQQKGVLVVHTYDMENDIQPLTEDDIETMVINLDQILKVIVDG